MGQKNAHEDNKWWATCKGCGWIAQSGDTRIAVGAFVAAAGAQGVKKNFICPKCQFNDCCVVMNPKFRGKNNNEE